MTAASTRRPAVSRLEVVVLLALGVLGLGLLFVLLSRQRENGLRIQCLNNLRRIGEAVHGSENGALPPARIAADYATWAVLLAPHLAKDHPLAKWDVSRSYFAQDAAVRQALVTAYFCPARARPGGWSIAGDVDPATGKHVPGALGDYAGVAGTGDPAHPFDGPDADGAIILGEVLQRQGDRVVHWRGRTSLPAIRAAHGLSTTLLFGEKHVPPEGLGKAIAGDGSLYDGQSAAGCSRVAGPGHPLAAAVTEPFNTNFGSAHPGVCQFLFADGSARPIAVHINDAVLGQMARRGK